jgi:hypothetical protein
MGLLPGLFVLILVDAQHFNVRGRQVSSGTTRANWERHSVTV